MISASEVWWLKPATVRGVFAPWYKRRNLYLQAVRYHAAHRNSHVKITKSTRRLISPAWIFRPCQQMDPIARKENAAALHFELLVGFAGPGHATGILLKQVAAFLINGMNAPARLFQRPLTETLLQPFPRRLASRWLKPRPSHTCNIKASEQQDLWPLMKHISPEKRKVEHHQQDTDNDLRWILRSYVSNKSVTTSEIKTRELFI